MPVSIRTGSVAFGQKKTGTESGSVLSQSKNWDVIVSPATCVPWRTLWFKSTKTPGRQFLKCV